MEMKPPSTVSQQVTSIRSKNFIVDDDDALAELLQCVNYYRLSAYFLPYKGEGQSRKVRFRRVLAAYEFDEDIRQWLYGVIGDIELYSRTVFSAYIAHTYGPLAHQDPGVFNDRHQHEKYQARLRGVIYDNRRTDVVKHHQRAYDGQFPIWVIIEFFSMGMLSIFYADLKRRDKKEIAKSWFDTGDQQLESWLRALTELRNKCAHYSRFYFWRFTTVPKNVQRSEWKMDHTLFSQIYMLSRLYPNQDRWDRRVDKLRDILARYAHEIDFAHIGFPANWEELISGPHSLSR